MFERHRLRAQGTDGEVARTKGPMGKWPGPRDRWGSGLAQDTDGEVAWPKAPMGKWPWDKAGTKYLAVCVHACVCSCDYAHIYSHKFAFVLLCTSCEDDFARAFRFASVLVPQRRIGKYVVCP